MPAISLPFEIPISWPPRITWISTASAPSIRLESSIHSSFFTITSRSASMRHILPDGSPSGFVLVPCRLCAKWFLKRPHAILSCWLYIGARQIVLMYAGTNPRFDSNCHSITLPTVTSFFSEDTKTASKSMSASSRSGTSAGAARFGCSLRSTSQVLRLTGKKASEYKSWLFQLMCEFRTSPPGHARVTDCSRCG